MLASKYTTKQAILEVMEQKRVQTNEDALNNMVYFYLFIFNNMVYWINLKCTVMDKEKVTG